INNMENTRAVYLFRRYFDRTATEEEISELMKWIDKDENEERIKTWMDKVWYEFQESEKIFTNEESEQILRSVLEEHLKTADKQKSIRAKRMRIVWIRAAAAAILIMLMTGGYFWYNGTKPVVKTTANVLQMKNDVAPGGNKATLTLANGKTIILDSVRSGQLANLGNSKVMKMSNGRLAYEVQSSKRGEEKSLTYNILTTPRGGQYELLLPDGSKVWLNAASSIHFPTAFTGNERKVEITGEAYFEIAQNATKPFIVVANGMNVTVLGTHFNVNAYRDDADMKVTLVEGRVRVASGNMAGTILKPMEQAEVNKEGLIKLVENADVNEALAWKEGIFQFDGDNMTTIMKKISRWYNVEVTYKNRIPSGHFTGIISRNTNLSEVLKMFELSGVQFRIEGKDLTVL
ncbi:MAG: FecR family protein, partial [Chitinophagaceae bacterium]